MTGSGTFLGHTEAVAMSVVGGRAEVTMPHLQRQTILYRSPQRLDSTFGSARRTDHWKSVVVVVIVVGAADPPHRAVISRFTGGQRIDNTGHGVATSSCAPGAWSTRA